MNPNNNRDKDEETPLVKDEEILGVKKEVKDEEILGVKKEVKDEVIFRVKDAKKNPSINKFNCQIILDPSNKYKISSDLDRLSCINTKYTMFSKAPNPLIPISLDELTSFIKSLKNNLIKIMNYAFRKLTCQFIKFPGLGAGVDGLFSVSRYLEIVDKKLEEKGPELIETLVNTAEKIASLKNNANTKELIVLMNNIYEQIRTIITELENTFYHRNTIFNIFSSYWVVDDVRSTLLYQMCSIRTLVNRLEGKPIVKNNNVKNNVTGGRTKRRKSRARKTNRRR